MCCLCTAFNRVYVKNYLQIITFCYIKFICSTFESVLSEVRRVFEQLMLLFLSSSCCWTISLSLINQTFATVWGGLLTGNVFLLILLIRALVLSHSNREISGNEQRKSMKWSQMKSAALIYNRPVQLLIYSLHGKHTHTHTYTGLVVHIISSSLHDLPLSSPNYYFHKHLVLLYLDALSCPVGSVFSLLLFCCAVMWLIPMPPPLPSRCSCSSHLFFCSLWYCVLHPQPKPRSAMSLCVRLTEPTFLVCFNSQRARVMSQRQSFFSAHTPTTNTHSLHAPVHPHHCHV